MMSPVDHVRTGCPATLLLIAGDDFTSPADGMRTRTEAQSDAAPSVLIEKLRGAGIPAACITFPRAEHAFDLILPQWAPAAQASQYDVEHFLALMA